MHPLRMLTIHDVSGVRLVPDGVHPDTTGIVTH